MNLFASALIDLDALWKIVAVSILAGAGVVVGFSYALLGVSRYQSLRRPATRAGYGLLVALAGGFCALAVVLGLIALAHK